MASKTRRSGAPTSSPSTSTPMSHVSVTSGSSQKRARSPLSPTRLSRIQEQQELKSLNDRLAAYIDRVRVLEADNNRLTSQVTTSQETVSREVSNVKTLYEGQLCDVRKLLDETSRDKSVLMMECGRVKEELSELRKKANKLEKSLASADARAIDAENKAADMSLKLNRALGERNNAVDAMKDLRYDNDKLKKQFEDAQRRLESEVLARIEAENALQSAKEECDLKSQIYEEQMKEIRTQKQVEVCEIDGKLQSEYENRLLDAVQNLRDEYESQLLENRDEISKLFQRQIDELNDHVRERNRNSGEAFEELRINMAKMEGMSAQNMELEAANAALLERVKGLEATLNRERIAFTNQLREKEEQLQLLRDEMTQALRDYQDLMDIKISLDTEISMYRKMLDSEELRLNLSSASSKEGGTPSRRTPLKAKRRAVVMSEDTEAFDFVSSSSCTGEVEVAEIDSSGKFVRVRNKGQEDISIGGWQLTRIVGEDEMHYRFHRNIVLKGGMTITVWSGDAGQTHNPPENLVMKGQKWTSGDVLVTKLTNGDGEEVAGHESKKEIKSTSVYKSRRTARGFDYGEQLYHSDRDLQNEKCSVM